MLAFTALLCSASVRGGEFVRGVEGELRGVDYTKDCELPFVPTIGLKIGDIKYNRDPHTVGEVVWCLDEQRFEVRCESELWEGTNESVDREMRERDWVTA